MNVTDTFTIHTYLSQLERTLLRRGYNAVAQEISHTGNALAPVFVRLHLDAGDRAKVPDVGTLEFDMAVPPVAGTDVATVVDNVRMSTRVPGSGLRPSEHASPLRAKIAAYAGPWLRVDATSIAEAVADQLGEAGIPPANPVGLL